MIGCHQACADHRSAITIVAKAMAKNLELDSMTLAVLAFIFLGESGPLCEFAEAECARLRLLDSPAWRDGLTDTEASGACRDWAAAETAVRAALACAHGRLSYMAGQGFEPPDDYRMMPLGDLVEMVRASWPQEDCGPDWSALRGLAAMMEQARQTADKVVGRFVTIDVMANRDEVIRRKEQTKRILGFPKRRPPPPPTRGTRDAAAYGTTRRLAAEGKTAKAIAKLTGVPLRTIHRWLEKSK
jgi:hypothetical protein